MWISSPRWKEVGAVVLAGQRNCIPQKLRSSREPGLGKDSNRTDTGLESPGATFLRRIAWYHVSQEAGDHTAKHSLRPLSQKKAKR